MIKQGTQEWLDARKGRVTASSAGAVLGLSPFMSRQGVMRAMVREALGAASEFPDPVPPPVAWGNAMEAGAIAEFEMDTGITTTEAPFIPFEEWLGCSPDRLIYEDYGMEQKCPYGIRNDIPPVFKPLDEQPHYNAQVQVCMYVTKRRGWYFNQWTPHGNDWIMVLRDDGWIQDNVPRLKQFWAEVQDEIVNNPDEHLQPLRVVVDTPEASKMTQEYDELVEAIERATERKADLLKEIAKLAGGKNALVAGRKLTLVEKAGSISYASAIKAIAPKADLEPYRGKPSSHWRLA